MVQTNNKWVCTMYGAQYHKMSTVFTTELNNIV